MEISMPPEHPLAKAILDASSPTGVWLVLKVADGNGNLHSTFRAQVEKWKRTDSEFHVEFETWDRYMESQAQLRGI